MAFDAPSSVSVVQFVRERIAERIGIPLDEVKEDAVLVDLGLQSIDAVLVSGEVEDEFGIELNPSTIFDHETVGAFAGEVAQLVQSQ